MALTSDKRTVGLVHRTTTAAKLVLWNPAERLGISHGWSSKDDTTFIACRPRFCGPSPRMQFPVEGYFPGRETNLGRRAGRGVARRRAVLMRKSQRVGGATGLALSRGQSSTPQRGASPVTFFLLSCAERTRHGSPDLSPRGAPVQPRPSPPIRGVDAGDQSASATFRRETGRWHGHDQYSILGRADRHLGVLLDYRIRGTDGEPTNPILLDDRNVTTPLLRRRMNRSPAAIDGCRRRAVWMSIRSRQTS